MRSAAAIDELRRHDDEFDSALNDVAGHLNAQHGRLIDLTIALLDEPDRWLTDGVHTPELFLAWRTGLSPQRARQIVTIARRAAELPESIDACRRGELAVDQLAAIASRAPWWADREVCELGTMLTVGQLRRTLATYPFPDIPAPHDTRLDTDSDAPSDGPATPGDDPASTGGDDTAPPATDDGVEGSTTEGRAWWGFDDDGRFRLHLDADALTGMTIDAALREAHDHLFQQGHTDVTALDAVLELARRSLATVDVPSRREQFRTYLHLRLDGTATDAHGAVLPDAIRRFVTCDGLLSPVLTEGAIPLSVGRSRRTIPQRTRRHVIHRDQGCRVPGCNVTRHLDIHHIVHWEHGGPTDTWNLIALCNRHHRMHHRGELGITGNADDPDGITFTNRHGRPVATTGARPRPPGRPPPEPAGTYAHPLGERLDSHWLYFNPPPEHRITSWAHHPHNPLRTF
jgi:hypothetical protein